MDLFTRGWTFSAQQPKKDVKKDTNPNMTLVTNLFHGKVKTEEQRENIAMFVDTTIKFFTVSRTEEKLKKILNVALFIIGSDKNYETANIEDFGAKAFQVPKNTVEWVPIKRNMHVWVKLLMLTCMLKFPLPILSDRLVLFLS